MLECFGMNKVTQVVIPVAGLGTRFLPATKAQSKTMFPVYDRPVVQCLAEEAVAAGIEKIIFVTDPSNNNLIQHFSPHRELEKLLKIKNKTESLRLIQEISHLAEFHFVIQHQPCGDADAIACAEDFLDLNSPVAVLFGDDLVDNPNGKNALQQLVDSYQQNQTTALLVTKVKDELVNRYGIISGKKMKNSAELLVQGIQEKPTIESASSNLAIIGKYILTPDFWPFLVNVSPIDGEQQLSRALLDYLCDDNLVHARVWSV